MNDLQKLALSQIKDELSQIQSILSLEKTDPAECGRTGSPTNRVLVGIMKAARWISAVEDDTHE